MNVPLSNLTKQYLAIKEEIDAAIQKTIESGAYIGKGNNPFILEFENAFEDFTQEGNCVACANGTDAIEIALRALNIGAGDEVIVPAQTWIATAEAVSFCGAKPVFVDIHPDNYLIDIDKIEAKINPRTQAIIPVHLYGLPVDMRAIVKLAHKHDLKIVEDCAQAHGASIEGRHVGLWGDVGTFSFFPGKNLGAYGDAGGIICSDPKLAQRCKQLTNHGQERPHSHIFEGRNSRMDGLQAAVLTVKLTYLQAWTQRREEIANQYRAAFTNQYRVQKIPESFRHAYHVFSIETEQRDAMREHLNNLGVATAVYYPTPVPLLKAYERFGHSASDFPVAVAQSKNTLAIPIYPEMKDNEVQCVIEGLQNFHSCNQAIMTTH